MQNYPKLIYPIGFEVCDNTKKDRQEFGINKVIDNGNFPCYVFNNDKYNVKNFIPIKFKEGIEKHPLYFAWLNMLLRCYDTSHPEYKNTGNKGTVVIEKWINSFEQFVKDTKFSSDMV